MDTRNTGTGMIVVASILGMVMLTWYFGGVEDEIRNPNQDPDVRLSANLIEVDLQRNRAGHYMVTGAINGRPVEFLLDTGATDVVIPEGLANEIGLPRGRAGRALTANGYVTVYATRIDSLTIGAINLIDVDASINPAMGSMSILLGMSALKQIEFVQQGESLTLRQYDTQNQNGY